MYDFQLGVQVVQAFEHLPDDRFHVEQRDALVLAPDDELQQIGAQHFEDHADVSAVDALGLEIVQQLDHLLSFRLRLVAVAHTAQQFDLIQGRLGIVGLDHFQRHETLGTATGKSSN